MYQVRLFERATLWTKTRAFCGAANQQRNRQPLPAYVKTLGTESEIELSKLAKAAYSVTWLGLSGQNRSKPGSLANTDVAASRDLPIDWSC